MKNKKIFLLFFVCLFIGVILFILFHNIEDNKNTTYNIKLENYIQKENLKEKTYSILEEKTIIKKETQKKEQQTNISKKVEETKQAQEKKGGISTIFSPFYSQDNWVSQINNLEYDRITLELQNNGTESILVNEDFIYYLGNNDDGYVVETKIIEGAGELQPGETRKIVAKGNGDARYFVIGGNTMEVDKWAIYRVMSTATTANDLNQPAANGWPKYTIDAAPLTADWDEISLLPCTTYYIDENKYSNIKINNNNSESGVMALEIDLYNKMQETLIINGSSFVIKDFNNKNIETFKIEEYKEELYSKQRKHFILPFKYVGNEYLYSVILHTNIGDITIENPENIYGLMKLN